MVYVGGIWKYGSQKRAQGEVCVLFLEISLAWSIYTAYEVDDRSFVSFLGCLVSSTINKIFKCFQTFWISSSKLLKDKDDGFYLFY